MIESCKNLLIRLGVRNQRLRFSSDFVRSDMIRRTILIRSCYPIFRPGYKPNYKDNLKIKSFSLIT